MLVKKGFALRFAVLAVCPSLLCVAGFELDFDDALASLKGLERRFAEKKQEASADAQVHRRVVQKMPVSEHFARSAEPRWRSKLDLDVTFEVGEVVRHKIWGYIAVIVGWDEFCKAPESWIQQMHNHPKAPTGKKAATWRTMPNYSLFVLEGGSGRSDDIRYIPQSNFVRLSGSSIPDAVIKSPLMQDYFSDFDETCNRFVPADWLRRRYPEDTTCLESRQQGNRIEAEL